MNNQLLSSNTTYPYRPWFEWAPNKWICDPIKVEGYVEDFNAENPNGTKQDYVDSYIVTPKFHKEIFVETSFEVPLEDHNIKIPKVVNQKISSVIMVEVKATLKPKA